MNETSNILVEPEDTMIGTKIPDTNETVCDPPEEKKPVLEDTLNEKWNEIKKFNACNSRTLLITHTDLDGIGPIVIMQVVYDQLVTEDFADFISTSTDVRNVEPNNVEDCIYNYVMEWGAFPHKIIITDLSPVKFNRGKNPFIWEIGNIIGKDNFIIIDHHKTALWLLDDPDIPATINIATNKSATLLFYNYLADLYFPDKCKGSDDYEYDILLFSVLKHYAEIVSRYDTWQWKKDIKYAKDEYENILLRSYGKDAYIKNTVARIIKAQDWLMERSTQERRNVSALTDELYNSSDINMIISFRKKHKQRALEELCKIRVVEYGHFKMLLLVAGLSNISFLNEIVKKVIHDYSKSHIISNEILAVIYPMDCILSMRSVGNVDVSLVAKELAASPSQGGGHPAAAGCTLTVADTKVLIDLYFRGSSFLDEYNIEDIIKVAKELMEDDAV